MKTKIAGCDRCDGEWDVDSFTILFCPLHAAARELLVALTAVHLAISVSYDGKTWTIGPRAMIAGGLADVIADAIARAGGLSQ